MLYLNCFVSFLLWTNDAIGGALLNSVSATSHSTEPSELPPKRIIERVQTGTDDDRCILLLLQFRNATCEI